MKKGFTIFELLAVMFIISTLAGLSISVLADTSARDFKDLKQSIKRVQSFSNQYHAEHNTYEGMSYNSLSEDITVTVVHAESVGFCVEATDGEKTIHFNSTKIVNGKQVLEGNCSDLTQIKIREKQEKQKEDNFIEFDFSS
ncbi:type II secretion system protein [Poseidonibacter ostreae]|uniref:Prepilin-type N-terminal cleavage/methylation domain-containing protein n=1 Tax=Poseidonibacter ostreae TaxID=2654171 RepID=A0A6L4WU30_9BACT|nr:type II secretion system protein [Poseidonibacter ostreae]KAB7889562.1 prepilin-type N-terminal cleavage/methylation domain-containing protein [Poseidonibacter ostreae]